MRRIVIALVAIVLLVTAAQASAAKKCSIEGTWFGSNEFGELFVHTIIKTGPGKYKSIAQSPAFAPPAEGVPGVEAAFFGVQGELEKIGPSKYRSTWMLVWKVDPAVYGLPLMAIVPYGDIKLKSCNGWKATFGGDIMLYDYGQDPFEDGVVVQSLEPFKASYWRLRQYPQ